MSSLGKIIECPRCTSGVSFCSPCGSCNEIIVEIYHLPAVSFHAFFRDDSVPLAQLWSKLFPSCTEFLSHDVKDRFAFPTFTGFGGLLLLPLYSFFFEKDILVSAQGSMGNLLWLLLLYLSALLPTLLLLLRTITTFPVRGREVFGFHCLLLVVADKASPIGFTGNRPLSWENGVSVMISSLLVHPCFTFTRFSSLQEGMRCFYQLLFVDTVFLQVHAAPDALDLDVGSIGCQSSAVEHSAAGRSDTSQPQVVVVPLQ
jgi:hypothetical protein